MNSAMNLKKLALLIKDIKFTMFSTVSPDGSIISRPMVGQEIEADSFDGHLWFFTMKDTIKVHSIKRDSHVNLAYAYPEKELFISLSGKAFISEDKDMMKELWTPNLRSWFPAGLAETDIALIGVDIQSAEVWDASTDEDFDTEEHFADQ